MYFIAFIVTSLLGWMVDKCRGLLRIILIFASILPLCFLAAFRDVSIGTDLLSYGLYECQYASLQDSATYLSRAVEVHGIGFSFLSWFICRNGAHYLPGLLFSLQLLTIGPIAVVLARLSSGSYWRAILIYALVIFPFSLNGMKQSVAAAFLFVSLVEIFRRKRVSFLIFLASAILFHQTAVLGILFYPLVRFIENSNSVRAFLGKYQMLFLFGFFLLLTPIVLSYGPSVVLSFSSLKESYSYQVEHMGQGDLNYSFGALFFVLVTLVAFFHLKIFKYPSIECASSDVLDMKVFQFPYTLALICSLGSLLGQLDIISSSLGRFGWYGLIFLPLLVVVDVQYGVRRSFNFLLLCAGFLFFYTRVVVLGIDQIYPYVFASI